MGMDIPIALLREIVAYDPETGDLTWLARPRSHFKADWIWQRWNRTRVGKPAWSMARNGYRLVNLGPDWNSGRSGRIAWALTYGKWPAPTVDHINRVRDDDRLINLRQATYKEQGANQKRPTK